MEKKGTVTIIERQDIDKCKDIIGFMTFPIADVYMWRQFPEAPEQYKHLEADFSDEFPIGKLKHPLHLWLDKIEKKPDDFMDKLYRLGDKYRSPCCLLADLIRGEGQMLRFLSEYWGSIKGWKKRYKEYWKQFEGAE